MRASKIAKLTLVLCSAVIAADSNATHAQTFGGMSYSAAGESSTAAYRPHGLPRYARTVARTAPTGRPYGNLVNHSGYGPATHSQPVPTPGRNAYYPQAGFVPTHYQSVSQAPRQKPFANIARSPNAFERYWPLMLQARIDPETRTVYIGL